MYGQPNGQITASLNAPNTFRAEDLINSYVQAITLTFSRI